MNATPQRRAGLRDLHSSRAYAAFLLVALLCQPSAFAHHRAASSYLIDEEVQIQGNLITFMYLNPHAYLTVDAELPDGKIARWNVEWGAAAILRRQGVTRATFKPGDHVVIWGNPGRNPEDHRLRLRRIIRPSDGTRWGFEKDQEFE